MCGLSLAWVTSENSTMLLESDILRLFFTGPYLVSSPLCSGVSCWLPLRSSTPTSAVRLSPVQPQLPSLCSPATNCLSWSPATNCLSLGRATNSHSRVQPPTSALLPPTVLSPVQLPTASLWVASSTLVRVPLPLPDTARFQVQESFVWFRAKTDSSALAAYPHSATKGKVEQSSERIVPSPPLRCSSYWKRSLLVVNKLFPAKTFICLVSLLNNVEFSNFRIFLKNGGLFSFVIELIFVTNSLDWYFLNFFVTFL